MSSRQATTGFVLGVLLLLGAGPTPPAGAQAPPEPDRPHKSVYGTLEKADPRLNGVFMKSNDGERLVWRFPAAVVGEVAKFEAGAPMIVIYRQISPSDKRVTAVAFPGTAETAQYVNMTGERILLRAAPAAAGECSHVAAGPVIDRTIPAGSLGDADGGCWCCGPAGGTCVPSNKTGLGKAFLISCFQ